MSTLCSDLGPVPRPAQVLTFPYPEIESGVAMTDEVSRQDFSVVEKAAPAGPSAAEIEAMIEKARVEATGQTEKRMQADCERRVLSMAEQIEAAIARFAQERSKYFAQVETEVVRLSLAIARRILHREAQVDTLLVAALVRVAVEKLETQSGISVRIAPNDCDRWRERLADLSERVKISFIPDPQLGAGDCVLETEMGSTELGIEAQLAEVEKGFFDLLAQRPSIS